MPEEVTEVMWCCGWSTAAAFSLKRLPAFVGDQWNHHERRGSVSPPPAERHIQGKANEKNSGQVRAKVGLPRIGMHRAALDITGHPALRAGKHKHDHQGRNR